MKSFLLRHTADKLDAIFQSSFPFQGIAAAAAPNSSGSFKPRAPCGERPTDDTHNTTGKQFQSTFPSRGATDANEQFIFDRIHFNPHSPRGERPMALSPRVERFLFQSTLPSRGATGMPRMQPTIYIKFQSTLPSRGATAKTHKKH